jgi:hypothetical protein
MKNVARWKVAQTTDYTPGTAEYRDAVDDTIIELTQLQMKVLDMRIEKHEQRLAARQKLEPRVRPS